MATVLAWDTDSLVPSVVFPDQAQSVDTSFIDEGAVLVELYQQDVLARIREIAREAEEDSGQVMNSTIANHLRAVANYVVAGYLRRGTMPSVLATFSHDGALVFSIKWARGARSDQLVIHPDGLSRLTPATI